MRKRKLLLPLTLVVLAAILAILFVLPQESYSVTVVRGLSFKAGDVWGCDCGGGRTCTCTFPW